MQQHITDYSARLSQALALPAIKQVPELAAAFKKLGIQKRRFIFAATVEAPETLFTWLMTSCTAQASTAVLVCALSHFRRMQPS